jgi:hypothetical protein
MIIKKTYRKTIDVGVDFRINFLVFEAADAGNFIGSSVPFMESNNK